MMNTKTQIRRQTVLNDKNVVNLIIQARATVNQTLDITMAAAKDIIDQKTKAEIAVGHHLAKEVIVYHRTATEVVVLLIVSPIIMRIAQLHLPKICIKFHQAIEMIEQEVTVIPVRRIVIVESDHDHDHHPKLESIITAGTRILECVLVFETVLFIFTVKAINYIIFSVNFIYSPSQSAVYIYTILFCCFFNVIAIYISLIFVKMNTNVTYKFLLFNCASS